MKRLIIISSILLLIVSQTYSICEKLPLPTSGIIEASPGDDLRAIVLSASKGATILLNSGTYNVGSTIFMNQDSITLMSKAQHRDSVILDGNQGGTPLDHDQFTNEIVAMRGNGTTLAHVSVCHARHHGIHAYPSSSANDDIVGVRMYDVHVYDCGQQLIKVNSNGNISNLQWIDEGILECSLIEFIDNSVMQEDPDYFYTGGIDVHGGENWIIRNNLFKNIEREATLMEHGVHFWSKSRGTLVENNIFHNVYRAIGFGMKTQENSDIEKFYDDGEGDNPYFDHVDGIIRNNVFYNELGIHMETGIELMNVKNVQVYNNTVFCEDKPFNSIEFRWPNTTVTVKNNIFSHSIMPRDGASFDTAANIQNASADLFEDVGSLDFHLKASATEAIDKGELVSDSLFGLDMDLQKPEGAIDIGADQYSTTGIKSIKGAKNDKVKGSSLSSFKVIDSGVSLNSAKIKDVEINIFNAKGSLVLRDKKKLGKGRSVINTSSLTDGVYLLKIKGREENRVLKLLWKK